MKNINTKEYWDSRFKSGDWESNDGRTHTQLHAKVQLSYLGISHDFNGTILDFGCGFGDAFPIYRSKYPHAKLIGTDVSNFAIEMCKHNYGNYAEFFVIDSKDIPKVDLIIASHVFEHLDNDKLIVKELLIKCKHLYIIVPYKEVQPLSKEHIRVYDESYFQEFNVKYYKVFIGGGWSEMGFNELIYNIYIKNVARFILGKPLRHRRKQIIFKLKGY